MPSSAVPGSVHLPVLGDAVSDDAAVDSAAAAGLRLKTMTLGCKVNQYETEFVRQGLQRAGYQDAAEGEAADLCIVNTCTVTNEGDAKSRQIIRRMARQNPDSRIVVMGCYATRAPDEVARLPQVAEVVTDKRELPDLLGRFGVIDLPTGIDRFAGRRRAYVKVQDGCLLRCSYCIIPMVRPELSSRPLEAIRDEVGRLVAAGHREVVLTGIHLGHYGVDWNRHKPKDQWVRLAHLVDELARLPGHFRIRLSSIEATEVTRELIEIIARHGDRIVPHLHVCLQSGSDAVLRRMRRRWGTRMFLDRCRMLREALPNPALTTDVIVGFPGETEAEFEQTLQTCREAGFSKIHVFPFSPRRGTPAADMPDQIDPQVRADRVHRLMELETELRRQYFQSLRGSTVQMLVDQIDPSDPAKRNAATGTLRATGVSGRYATVEATLCDTTVRPSDLVAVRVTDSDDERLFADDQWPANMERSSASPVSNQAE